MEEQYLEPANTIDSIHRDLLATITLVYNPSKLQCSQLQREQESAEYGAYAFKLNGRSIRFRVAKITPTKVGQFVTLWKRLGNGPIQPYDISDPIDFFIISTRKDNHFGQFIFPKSVLCEKNIISTREKEGKRAIRIYPPWDRPTSLQAKKTQMWQLEYFLAIQQNSPIDYNRSQMLYCQK